MEISASRSLAEQEALIYISSPRPQLCRSKRSSDAMRKMTQAGERRPQRRSPRVTPDPLLIIHLPAGNQGVVFDVSPEGVGFLASAPVEDAATIHFEISGRAARGSEAAGQLMWKDSSGKRGGLRFTHLPEQLRALIASFLPGEQIPGAISSAPKTSGGPNPPLEEERILDGKDQIFAPPALEEPAPAGSRARFTRVANALTATVACVIAVAIWYSVNRSDARASLSYLQRHFSAVFFREVTRVPQGWNARTTAAQTTPPIAPAAPEAAAREPVPASAESNAPSPDESLNDAPHNDGPGVAPLEVQNTVSSAAAWAPEAAAVTAAPAPPKRMSDRPPQAAPEVSPSQPSAPVAEDETQDKLAIARKLLQPNAGPSDQAKAVGLLWQAVEKGNAVAEVELAGLYLTGRGVAKSCSQALVLLSAVRARRNPLAEKSLAALSEYGCAAPGGEPDSDPAEPLPPSP